MPHRPLRQRALQALVLALASACAAPASPARAQSAATPWPAALPAPAPRTMTLPGPAAAPRIPGQFQATAAPVSVVPSPDWTLRPLPLATAGTEISGETGSLDMGLWLTAGQAAATRAVQVAYRAAVSVRPEGSTLTLLVNGTVAGRTRIFAPSGLETVRFDLPEGLLAGGFNRITLAAEMRHRVDCSVPATFELWTRVEPSATGLLVAGTAQGPAGIADVPALPAAADGSMPLRVVLPGKLSPAGVGAVLQLVQALALATGGRPLAVDFGAPAGGPAGANLVLGTAEDLAAAGIPARGLEPGRPALLAASPERRATLAVLADGPEDLSRAVADLGRASAARVAKAWTGAGHLLSGDETVTLRDLGLATRDFGGRVFRTGFDVTMPADLLPADYGSVVLAIDGATAKGLTADAQLRVEVNGRHVAAAPLARSGGETLRGFPIHLPLGVFRPGRNHVELAASLPTAEDAACSPAGAGASEPPRFLLLDSTALLVPRLARAVRVPELSQLAGGALPFRPGREAWLVVPAPDRDSMGAAATLIARLAQAAGGVVPFRFQATLPAADGLDRLVVAGQDVLDPALAHGFGPLAKPVATDPARAAQAASGAAPAQPGTDRPAPGSPAAPDWARRWPGAVPDARNSMIETATRTLGETSDRLSRTLDGWIADWFRRGEAAHTEASLAVAESDGGAGATQVLVVGASPEALRAGVDRLVRPDLWPGLAGAETRLGREGLSVVRRAQRFSLGPGAATAGNLRLVLAGWLSLNPATYGGGAILLALVLALATGLVLRHVGRPSS